ncbi:MAG: copper homeostasis protein CutC [Acidobacteriia bacterium]|nr:copper homeostasis protein CutC [Terriglobia bacterium]
MQSRTAHGAREPLPRVVAQPQIRPGKILLEICLDSVESAAAAERGGADRVELCAGLPEGGTTPSAGMIAAVRRKVAIGLQVMVRPRGGDFHYSADEFSIMQRDILIAKQLGVNGVVFGILTVDGNVDKDRMRQLIDLAHPLKVTCHRAFDMTCDLARALDDLMDMGVDRVLTSGGKKSAVDAMPTLAQLVQQAQGRISIMACGELSIVNVKAVVEYTHVREVHAGLGTAVTSAMRFKNQKISMGTLANSEYQHIVVPESGVRELRAAIDSI